MNNLICACSGDVELLEPYINKPVYIRGYCWAKKFDGWTVIYESGNPALVNRLVFDYRGKTYSAFGFLPYVLGANSNGFWEEVPND